MQHSSCRRRRSDSGLRPNRPKNGI
jgi:hypothetical protein